MSEIKPPKGIGAVITDASGQVVAHYFDFDRAGYGGFKLWESQRLRVKKAVFKQYVEQYCYADMFSAMDEYLIEQIVRKLIQKEKIKLIIIPIGYEELKIEDVNQ